MDYKGIKIFNTNALTPEISTVNEAGLYKLLFNCNNPTAKLFQQWIIEIVNPSIRKKKLEDLKVQIRPKIESLLETKNKNLDRTKNQLEIIDKQYNDLKFAFKKQEECLTNITSQKLQLTQENLKLKSEL